MFFFLQHCPLSQILPFLFFFNLLQALAQKQNLTDDDISAYQDLADSFFMQWLNLVGYDGRRYSKLHTYGQSWAHTLLFTKVAQQEHIPKSRL
jgi:hypothetical protein